MRAILFEPFSGKMFLRFTAEHTHKNRGGFQVIGHAHIIHTHEAALLIAELPPENVTHGALEQFPDALMAKRAHDEIYTVIVWRQPSRW
ncbi:uncharacterized protein METZ01_LOCUS321715, partial [marine metagenome]